MTFSPTPWHYDKDVQIITCPGETSDTATRMLAQVFETAIMQDEPDHAEDDGLLMAAAPMLYAALSVMVLDPNIVKFLAKADPKALEQAQAALAFVKVE